MSKDIDLVEYTILSRKTIITIPASSLRPGDIIKLPEEHLTKGTNGKVLFKERKENLYTFEILLANMETFELITSEKDKIIIIV